MSLPESSMRFLTFLLFICICSKIAYSENSLYEKVCARTSFAEDCRKMLMHDRQCLIAKDIYEVAYRIIEISQHYVKTYISAFKQTMAENHPASHKEKLEECISTYELIFDSTQDMQNFVKNKRSNVMTLVTATASSNKVSVETCASKIGKIWPMLSENTNDKMKKYYEILEAVEGIDAPDSGCEANGSKLGKGARKKIPSSRYSKGDYTNM